MTASGMGSSDRGEGGRARHPRRWPARVGEVRHAPVEGAHQQLERALRNVRRVGSGLSSAREQDAVERRDQGLGPRRRSASVPARRQDPRHEPDQPRPPGREQRGELRVARRPPATAPSGPAAARARRASAGRAGRSARRRGRRRARRRAAPRSSRSTSAASAAGDVLGERGLQRAAGAQVRRAAALGQPRPRSTARWVSPRRPCSATTCRAASTQLAPARAQGRLARARSWRPSEGGERRHYRAHLRGSVERRTFYMSRNSTSVERTSMIPLDLTALAPSP